MLNVYKQRQTEPTAHYSPTCPLNHFTFMLSGGLMLRICGVELFFKYGKQTLELKSELVH